MTLEIPGKSPVGIESADDHTTVCDFGLGDRARRSKGREKVDKKFRLGKWVQDARRRGG